MKKLFCIVAVSMMMVPALKAQNQGSMYVGGRFGIDVGTASTTLKAGNETITEKDSSIPNTFTISPEFGYFVMDNWEVNANLKYGISSFIQKKNSSGTHEFTFGVGTNYHIQLCDRISYAPGIGLDFGLQNRYSKVDSGSVKVRESDTGFLFGMDFQLARFNFRLNDHFALDLNVLGMKYGLASYGGNDEGLSYTSNRNSFRFGTGSLGLRYYF